MKPVLIAGALAGAALPACAASVNFTIEADKTIVAVSETVTFTVSVSTDLIAPTGTPLYLSSAIIDIVNTGAVEGTVSAFDFTYDQTDLNGLGTPRAIVAESTPSGNDLLAVHWNVNVLNGAPQDFQNGIFGSPFTLGSFSMLVQEPTNVFVDFDNAFTILPDQDFIDMFSTLEGGVTWATGNGTLFDPSTAFNTWTVNGNPIPAPASALTLAAMLLGARRRRALNHPRVKPGTLFSDNAGT